MSENFASIVVLRLLWIWAGIFVRFWALDRIDDHWPSLSAHEKSVVGLTAAILAPITLVLMVGYLLVWPVSGYIKLYRRLCDHRGNAIPSARTRDRRRP